MTTSRPDIPPLLLCLWWFTGRSVVAAHVFSVSCTVAAVLLGLAMVSDDLFAKIGPDPGPGPGDQLDLGPGWRVDSVRAVVTCSGNYSRCSSRSRPGAAAALASGLFWEWPSPRACWFGTSGFASPWRSSIDLAFRGRWKTLLPAGADRRRCWSSPGSPGWRWFITAHRSACSRQGGLASTNCQTGAVLPSEASRSSHWSFRRGRDGVTPLSGRRCGG